MGILFDAILGKLRTKDEGGGGGGGSIAISDVTGLTSALADKIDVSSKGVANGVPSLDEDGKVPKGQLPDADVAIAPPGCSDMGVVLGETTIAITWSDPDPLIISGWKCADWQRTVAVMKEGGYPSSVTDGVIVAATSRAPSTDDYPLPSGVTYGYKDAYKMDSKTVSVESSDDVCIKLFSCSTAGKWNNLLENEYPAYTSYSWGQLADYADAGSFTQHIPIGSLLDAENTDFPAMKWLVVDTDGFAPQNSAIPHHVCLLSYRVLFQNACDAAETQWELTADTAAVTGIVYGININGTMTTLTEGTDWDAGDTSVTYDGVSYPISAWYEKNPNANYSSGSNYTPQTNAQQWMDSDGDAYHWYQKRNLWDTCGDALKARPGFMHGLPQAFRDCMIPCTRTIYVHSSFRRRGIGKTTTYNAKAFFLTLKETTNAANDSVVEGVKQLSFLAQSADDRKCYLDDGETATNWWLGSAYTNYANNVNYVNTAGSTSGYNASYAYGFRPACAFGKPVS